MAQSSICFVEGTYTLNEKLLNGKEPYKSNYKTMIKNKRNQNVVLAYWIDHSAIRIDVIILFHFVRYYDKIW